MLGLKTSDPGPRLSLQDADTWVLSQGGVCRTVLLRHVWPAFAWVTFRFQYKECTHQAKPIELTVWKASMAAAEWRDLRRKLATQLAKSERDHQKESP
jgi:hypothetical protein